MRAIASRVGLLIALTWSAGARADLLVASLLTGDVLRYDEGTEPVAGVGCR